MQELHWPLTVDYEKSIQRAYRQAIQQADEHIYIETQYFIGSGKQWGEDAITSVENDLPAQVVERIKQRRADGVPFHVYIVTPMYPEGSPVDGSILEQRWLEWRTMEWMIKQLGNDWYKSLSFYFLANWNTVPAAERRTSGTREEMVRAHKRYMIYVHSKLMMVDDRYIIFGSANLNERSLAGNRDTEIATAFWPLPGKEDECVKKLRAFRLEVWKEHLNMDASGFGQDASSESSWKKLRSAALENYKSLRSFRSAPTDGHLCRLPLVLKKGVLSVAPLDLAGIGQQDQIPDAPTLEPDKALKSGWGWSSPGAWLMRKLHVAE
jgi:phospholipase D1/2